MPTSHAGGHISDGFGHGPPPGDCRPPHAISLGREAQGGCPRGPVARIWRPAVVSASAASQRLAWNQAMTLSRRDRNSPSPGSSWRSSGAIDQTIVSTALPRIVEDLGGLERYAWVFTAPRRLDGAGARLRSSPTWQPQGDAHGRGRVPDRLVPVRAGGRVQDPARARRRHEPAHRVPGRPDRRRRPVQHGVHHHRRPLPTRRAREVPGHRQRCVRHRQRAGSPAGGYLTDNATTSSRHPGLALGVLRQRAVRRGGGLVRRHAHAPPGPTASAAARPGGGGAAHQGAGGRLCSSTAPSTRGARR